MVIPVNEALNSYKKWPRLIHPEMIFHVKILWQKIVFILIPISTIQEAYNVMEKFKIKQLPIATFGKNNENDWQRDNFKSFDEWYWR